MFNITSDISNLEEKFT